MAVGDCKCPMEPNMSYDELMFIAENSNYCTSSKNRNGQPGWVCSNFLNELDRARAEKRSVEYRRRKMIKDGVAPEKVMAATSTSGGKKRKFKKQMKISKGSLKELE